MKYVPASEQDATPVKVVVQLEGESVGNQAGDAVDAGRVMSLAARSSARAALAARQQPVVDLVRQRGGAVLARYQDAYNGVAVRVARKDLSALRALPGVVAVHAVGTHPPTTSRACSTSGGNAAWKSNGVTGKGIKVAIIDTGVDYTHADFGGPGTKRAYRTNDRTVVEPGSFPTEKVVGGYDFVGDAYDAGDPDHSTPRPGRRPARLRGPRLPRRGQRRRSGRHGQGRHLPRPVRRQDLLAHLPRRSRRRAAGLDLRVQGLRLRGVRRRRGHHLRARPRAPGRHRRGQHVPRVRLRHRVPRRPTRSTRSPAPASRSSPRPATPSAAPT